MVTYWAAIMARVSGSSVSSNFADNSGAWMRCYVHSLNNALKAAMEACEKDPILQRLYRDFCAMKKTVCDSSRSGWNSWLPHGYHLRQEVETRFGTHFLVAECFLHSAESVCTVIVQNWRKSGIEAFQSITRGANPITGFLTSYPTIEAIVDSMKPVFEAILLFESTNSPTLHVVLSNLHHCFIELERISRGSTISRKDGEVLPNHFTRKLCKSLRNILQKIDIHDLWLVGCFLHPYFRSLSFWHNKEERCNFRM